jgi:uncharacterized protein YcbX
MTQTIVGSIVSLWRYPVKSMLGEELNASEVTKRGLLGDRAYALVDSSDRKVATAKNPRKWPQLFDCRAALTGIPVTGAKVPPVRIILPNGDIVESEQSGVDQIFSKMLNRAVKLSASPDVQTSTAEEYWPDIEGLDPCARCVMTTLAQGDLPKDAGILRAAAQHHRANVGVYASVLEGGKIRRGEPVSVE